MNWRALPWRRLLAPALAVVVVALAVGSFVMVRDARQSVMARRADARERDAEERRRSEATDLRLCEIAINFNAERFLRTIERLTGLSEPAEDAEEERRRKESREVIAEEYQHIDCQEFVASTARGDQP